MILFTTGPEALEAIKATFPDTWKKEVAAAQRIIRILKNCYKCDTGAAVDKYIDNSKSDAKRLLILATGTLMLQQEAVANAIACLDVEMGTTEANLQRVPQRIPSVANQIAAVDFYTRRMAKHSQKMKALAKSILALPPVPITYTSKILGNAC